jgi:flavin-dependent dehydrogenase
MIDNLIVGSGPAGLICAIKLARSGLQVAILDRPATHQHKIGESLPSGINTLLAELGLNKLDKNKHAAIAGSISMWGGMRRNEDFALSARGSGWRLNRPLFEQDLLQMAQDEGVLHYQALMQHCHFDNDRWLLDTDLAGQLSARWLIDASGRNGVVVRSQKSRRIKGSSLVAVWAVGSIINHQTMTRTLIESCDDGWWYGAYLPTGEPVAIFHTDSDTAARLKREPAQWRHKLRHTKLLGQHIDAEDFKLAHLTAADARGMRLAQPYGKQWAACGDAALCFDPLSSQGIFNAIASADMLSHALLSNDQNAALTSYGHKLAQINHLYQHRRQAFYQQACDHHQSPFWLAHSTDEMALDAG